MTKTKDNKPDIVQLFDFYEERVYYKIIPGLLFSSNMCVRADRLKEWKEWKIECKELPDKVYINGQEAEIIIKK